MRKLFLTFCLFTSSLWGLDFRCQMPELTSFSFPWELSPDFTTLNFEGPLAADKFKDIGNPGARFFSVIAHNDWCRSLQDAIMCETPMSALVEIESGENATVPKTKTPLRYFLMILNYRADGWAILRIRAQRTDSQLPISFMVELPSHTCSVNP
ncbi:MAG: hypothetical protein ACKN9V_08265 [Pseudomonadota bacterium]